mgnify:CR=1 FL=1
MEEFLLPWTYMFHERGGYYCMTDAIHIIDSSGQYIVTINLGDFHELDDPETKEHCEKLAKFIVDKCNSAFTEQDVQ